ncbi:hypothetical protein [Dyella sp.]|uniref:hypothetical protein n=1 Tax=Dyella sp. TaxID=1869338 RepID=UPI003F7FBB3B
MQQRRLSRPAATHQKQQPGIVHLQLDPVEYGLITMPDFDLINDQQGLLSRLLVLFKSPVKQQCA